MDNDWFLMRY